MVSVYSISLSVAHSTFKEHRGYAGSSVENFATIATPAHTFGFKPHGEATDKTKIEGTGKKGFQPARSLFCERRRLVVLYGRCDWRAI